MTAPTYTSTSTMPRNSASSISQMTALLKKHSTSSSAQCTGLRARITPSAAHTSTAAKMKNRIVGNITGTARRQPVGRDHGFIALADSEQLVLVHDVVAAIFHVIFMQARLDDGIDRAGLLAETRSRCT